LNHSWHVLHTPHKVDDECQSVQEMDYRAHFTCSGLLDFLEQCKNTGQCVNVVRLSANCDRAFQRTYKLCTHAHRLDRSAAAAVF
jgi:hypothetical protein